jgi:hypothetical protein
VQFTPCAYSKRRFEPPRVHPSRDSMRSRRPWQVDRNHLTTVYDIHATILHQLGIDHKRLTYRF